MRDRILSVIMKIGKNDNVRMKATYRSEPYDLYGERGNVKPECEN